MLIARAPVRISFAGGGTDLDSYASARGGLVVSATIDKYVYVVINLTGDDTVQVASSDYRTFFRQGRDQPVLWEGDLALPRALLHEFGIDSGVSIFLASEIPPGTGLGSSSTVTVLLTRAFSALCGFDVADDQIAELASRIEIDKLRMPIGRQDQYAASFGGLNVIHFDNRGAHVEPLGLAPSIERDLQQRLMLFFTGTSRSAASILREQDGASRSGDDAVIGALDEIKAMARETIQLLRSGDLDGFGALLDRSWNAKKRLATGVTTPQIDRWYETARSLGAAGGKVAGAGGGGFLLLYCEEEFQPHVTAALEQSGLVKMDFRFEHGGAVVLSDSIPRVRRFGHGTFPDPRGSAAVAHGQ